MLHRRHAPVLIPGRHAALAAGAALFAACSSGAGESVDTGDAVDTTVDAADVATTTTRPASSPAPASTGPTTSGPTVASAPAAAADFDDDALSDALARTAAALPMIGASVMATVRGADGIVWSGAETEGDRQAAADDPIRAASVGKTFTAATILRLVEDGRISLDQPIADLLTVGTAELLTADGYDLDAITVAHLLHHTAGLFDYGFGDGSPFLERVLTDPAHRWSRDEQLRLAVEFGDPLAAPGTAFRYGDTAYVLLGEIIEQLADKPYAEAMVELLGLADLGIDGIWNESDGNPPTTRPIAATFFGEVDLTALDFSADGFGGGGLAGPTADFALFFEHLLAGRVFRSADTLSTMLTVPATNVGVDEFGLLLGDGGAGIYRVDVEAIGECWTHRGFFGTIAMTCPDTGLTVVATTNTADTDPRPLAEDLLRIAATAAHRR